MLLSWRWPEFGQVKSFQEVIYSSEYLVSLRFDTRTEASSSFSSPQLIGSLGPQNHDQSKVQSIQQKVNLIYFNFINA